MIRPRARHIARHTHQCGSAAPRHRNRASYMWHPISHYRLALDVEVQMHRFEQDGFHWRVD